MAEGLFLHAVKGRKDFQAVSAGVGAMEGLPPSVHAVRTLRELGMRQGTRVDDFRDEDPGRILHEMRYGEMTAFEERPHSPYYGCADATPLNDHSNPQITPFANL